MSEYEYDIRKGKALAAIVGVKEYDSEEEVNLSGATIDRNGLKELFEGEFEYKVMSLDRNRITKRDFVQFLNEVRAELHNNSANYDAFVFGFTGHGDRKHVILSDSRKYGRIDLYKFFNGENVFSFKDKPKLLLLQACKGATEAPNLNQSTLASPMDVENDDVSQAPDDNIIVFDSNSDGYVSFINGGGGFLVQSFIKVMSRNKRRMQLDRIARMTTNEVKRLNQQMASAETMVFKQYGVTDEIYFCK